jgi:Leucine-rich repeat (LRR) protein
MTLPAPVWGLIFGFLDVEETLTRCRPVCRQFRGLRAYRSHLCLLNLGHVAASVLDSVQVAHVRSLTVGTDVDLDGLGVLHNVRVLDLVNDWFPHVRCPKARLLPRVWPELEALYVRYFALVQTDLEAWSVLSLRKLDLRRSTLRGVDLRALRYISTLDTLVLSSTNLCAAQAAALESLTNLRHLDLSRNPLDDQALGSLRTLTRLEFLRLARLVITDRGVLQLAALEHLCVLDLSHTYITGVLAPFRSVRVLKLTGCSDIKGELTLPAGLRSLSLSGCRNLTAASVSALRVCADLEHLDISGIPGALLRVVALNAPRLKTLTSDYHSD